MDDLQIKNFGRYVLQICNEVIKKRSKLVPLNEESGEKLVEELYNKWKEQQFYCGVCKTNVGCSYMNFGVKCKVEEDFDKKLKTAE